MTSPSMIVMYAIFGPFAIGKLYAKNLMRKAYQNQVLLKIAASILSLAVGSQIVYKYRSSCTILWLIYGLLSVLINYWYIIPLLLIYIFPIIEKLTKSWLLLIDFFSEKILRPYSTKFRQLLPSIWTLESNDQKLWPIESIRFMLVYGSIGPGLYCGYHIYQYLFFGISFNLCISTAWTVLLQLTFWHVLEAIDKDLYPFIFAIIVQYYIIPYRSPLNIPLTLLMTTFLFPFLNKLLTSQSIRNIIHNLRILNFRTFLETNANYKQFFTEFVNLFLTIYLTYSIGQICFQSRLSWLLTFAIVCFLILYFYTNLIRLIRFEPNAIMFIFSSFILSKSILHQRINQHFIYNFFLITMILTFYFALIYPFLYHILRRSIIKSAEKYGLKLKLIREELHRIALNFNEKHIRIVYVHNSSKYFILHLCNLIITLAIIIFFSPINILIRLIISLLTYLLLGRLLLTHGLEVLANFIALCASITAGAHVYAKCEKSILLTMPIAFVTYLSTIGILFPLGYHFIQLILSNFIVIDLMNRYLQNLFQFLWSYFDIIWSHIVSNFHEVKNQIEQSRINFFSRSTRR